MVDEAQTVISLCRKRKEQVAKVLTKMQGSMPSTPRLAVPVHFLCPKGALWPELRDPPSLPLAPDVMAMRAGSSISAWVIQVYHWMKSQGEAVTISDRLDPDAINIAHIRSFGRKQRLSKAYVMVARADGHAPQMANFVLHQNGQFKKTGQTASVPHWPQPGLKPRDPARGSELKTLSYMGTAQNLGGPFQSTGFRTALSDMGVELDLRFSQGSKDCLPWSDYSQTDAVLAVRGRDAYLESLKPASKLINAWSAGAPAILGSEPAFGELRQSPLDYFEVTTSEDALDAVRKLKSEPELFRSMIAHGAQRAQDYTEDRVGARWIDLLNGAVAQDFKQWQARSSLRKWVFVGKSLLSETRAQKLHMSRIKSGAAA